MERMNGAARFRGRESGLEEEPWHRSLNENSIMEEEFPWLTELVNETETPIPTSPTRRCFNDSSACSNACRIHCTPNVPPKEFSQLRYIRTSVWGSNECLHWNDSRRYIAEGNNVGLSIGRCSNGLHAAQGNSWTSNAAPEGSTSCPERNNAFQAKNARSDSDSRRARQQLPRRSRGFKCQCINELESSIQTLKDVTWKFFNALGLLDRMCSLSFENMILNQRMESMFQEELIRGYQYENYQQEMARLHAVFQQQIYEQPSSSQGRFNSSRNLNSQSANSSSKY